MPRIRDPLFGQSFWSMCETIESVNSRKKKVRWLTKKQLQDKFGEESEIMEEPLPKRKHPKNPKVFQWMDCDDMADGRCQEELQED